MEDVVDKVFPKQQDREIDLTTIRRRLQDVLNDLGLELETQVKTVEGDVVVTFGMLIGQREIDRVLCRMEDLRPEQSAPKQIHQNTSLLS